MATTNFKPAPGSIVLIPDLESLNVGEVVLSSSYQAEMPTGTVIVAGKMPIRFPKLREGDRIAYAKGNYVSLQLLVNGVLTNVTVVYASEFRGKFISNEKTHFGVLPALAFFAGFTFGQFFTIRGFIRSFAEKSPIIQGLVAFFGRKGR
jgi:hypothetical protein